MASFAQKHDAPPGEALQGLLVKQGVDERLLCGLQAHAPPLTWPQSRACSCLQISAIA